MKVILFFLVVGMFGTGCGSPSSQRAASSVSETSTFHSKSLPADGEAEEDQKSSSQPSYPPLPEDSETKNPKSPVLLASENQNPPPPSEKVAGYLTSQLSTEQKASYQKFVQEQEGSFFPPEVVRYHCTWENHSVKLTLRQYRRVGQSASLLCDFFAGDTLQAFAIHQPLFCESRMERMLATLSNVGYDCLKE